MRPFSFSRPRARSSSLIRSSLERLICDQRRPALLGHLRDRPVAGDAGVVDDDVDAVDQLIGDPRRSVVVGDVELDRLGAETTRRLASGPRRAPERRAARASRRRGAAWSRSPRRCPREAPVTSATLPSSGRFQSSVGVLSTAAPIRITWPDTYAERGESRKRSVESISLLGALGHVDQLHRRAAAHLLAERSGEALQRPLRGRLAGRPSSRRGAEHDHAAGPGDALHVGMEEALQLDQLAWSRRCRWRRRRAPDASSESLACFAPISPSTRSS